MLIQLGPLFLEALAKLLDDDLDLGLLEDVQEIDEGVRQDEVGETAQRKLYEHS